MRSLRIVLVTLALALSLSCGVIVGRLYHPYYWLPSPCYHCW